MVACIHGCHIISDAHFHLNGSFFVVRSRDNCDFSALKSNLLCSM